MRTYERRGVSRREFLRGSVAAGLGLTTWQWGGGLPEALAAKTVTLNFKGWNYEPDLVRENLDIFEKQYPNIKVNYEAIGGNYMDKIAALFIANAPLDCLYVRDTNFAAWVDAGWLRPLEGLPGVDEYKKLFYKHNLEAMSYNGKLYGLPYYTDFHVWAYNEEMLNKAGFDKPGRTLDEITEQALKIKEKGILEYPIILGYAQVAWGHWEWWSYVYASEVSLFDEEANPTLQDDPRVEALLQWLVDGIHKYKIIDPKTVEMNTNMARDTMAAGKLAFTGVPKYDIQRLNDPKLSQVVGKIKMMHYPSLEPHLHG
ncbi:MAG: extracellular solute-binding protein, partial [Nitrospinota bacterium]